MLELQGADLRQSLRKLADTFDATGEPILLKLGQRPVGVIVSLKDFRERFSIPAACDARLALVDEILSNTIAPDVSVDQALAELRSR
jgi:hypothetical protein